MPDHLNLGGVFVLGKFEGDDFYNGLVNGEFYVPLFSNGGFLCYTWISGNASTDYLPDWILEVNNFKFLFNGGLFNWPGF